MKEHSLELINYGDEDIPVGLRLSAYPLHTEEWRQAFFERLAEAGYAALLEASAHAYSLLVDPKDYHCAIVAQLANVSGSGKQAIYNVLRKFLDDFLTWQPVPSSEPDESLAEWHARAMTTWADERAREMQLVRTFASILNGEQPFVTGVSGARFAEVIYGPWGSPADLTRDLPPPADPYERSRR